jgi:hypothetical protein
MQILQPLTVEYVGLTARNMMDMLSVDQMNFNTPSFKDLEKRYPIDSRGFHRDGVDAALA